MRGYSAIMNRYSSYTHIYTQIEKTNPIFKTWFAQHKISSYSPRVFKEFQREKIFPTLLYGMFFYPQKLPVLNNTL
mgnify:CR=1 FL=1